MTEFNEEAIDLRPYVSSLWTRRYWIIGFGLVGIILGFAISSIVSPSYEASALVAATLPHERLEFDSRVQTVTGTQPLQAYPDLALSDAVLIELLDRVSTKTPITLTQLRKMVSASPGSDPSIIKLTVEYKDPKIASEMANAWAELFVALGNEMYGYQGDEQLVFFEARLEEVADQLEAAEQALIDFQTNNRTSILTNELAAAEQTQADYLAKQRQTELILQDIESLLSQERNGNFDDPVAVERLASILLQVRALGGVPGVGVTPLQVQLALESPTDLSDVENRETILQLRDMLMAQGSQIEERLTSLEPQILSLQREKYQLEVLNNRLNRDLEVAEETYTTLARTVDEKRITSEDTTSGIKLASRTAVPERPSSPNVVVNSIIAGVVGIFLSIVAIIMMQWWRDEAIADPIANFDTTVQLVDERDS